MNHIIGETLNTAVLDSGCSKMVCGQLWLDCYIESLSEEDRNQLQEEESSTRFKFRDGSLAYSLKR